ncbi:DUF4396 domain-containing protein [Salinisphaera aquimarina]|uniref:DUF4396 domain-containing protein n=1 Tax=Salinisphaera aquimarina TaxID=2094031 RepID=A0ABV7EV43_9GAMM
MSMHGEATATLHAAADLDSGAAAVLVFSGAGRSRAELRMKTSSETTWIAAAIKLLLPEKPHVASATFWFMMQIAMIIGFATAYPANWWLIKRGIKHGM